MRTGENLKVALAFAAIHIIWGSLMAFVWLIKIRPPAIVSTYSYVNPVVAVLLGWGLGKTMKQAK